MVKLNHDFGIRLQENEVIGTNKRYTSPTHTSTLLPTSKPFTKFKLKIKFRKQKTFKKIQNFHFNSHTILIVKKLN